jgi:hypothetical protein
MKSVVYEFGFSILIDRIYHSVSSISDAMLLIKYRSYDIKSSFYLMHFHLAWRRMNGSSNK